MEFEFVNRIWLPQLGAKNKRKIILFTLGGIVLLLNLFQAFMDGFDKVNWFVGLVVPALLVSVGLMGTRRGGYTTSSCKLSIDRESIRITYPAIDRMDGKGVHSEVLTFPRQSIQELQFSEVLQSFRILGQCNCVSSSSDGPKQLAFSPENTLSEGILYPESEQIPSIINAFETVLGLGVRRMDG